MATAPTFYSNPPGHPSPAYNAPLSNGGPMYDLSRGDMAATGSTPLGFGKIQRTNVPATQGSQAPLPNTTATSAAMQQQQAALQQQAAAMAQQQAAAAAQQQAAAKRQQEMMIAQQAQIRAQQQAAAAAAVPQQVPVAAPVAANLYPQTTPTGAAVVVANAVPTNPLAAACNYAGPVAGGAIDCSDFTKAVGGDLKSRVLTAYSLVTPAHHHTDTIRVDLTADLHHILKYKHSCSEDRDGDLSRVVIMGIRLISAKNKLPTCVVVRATGCKGRDYDCKTGKRGLLVMPPGYKEDCGANPRALHLYAPSVSVHAFSRFGKIRVADLSKDVTAVPGKAWSLVDVNSPIVEVIKASQAELKSTLQDVKIIEGMMPVKNELVDSVKQFLQENIAKFPGTDCTKFSIDFARSAGCHFAEKGDIAAPEEQVQFHLREGKTVYVKIICDYVIISNTKVGTDMSAPRV